MLHLEIPNIYIALSKKGQITGNSGQDCKLSLNYFDRCHVSTSFSLYKSSFSEANGCFMIAPLMMLIFKTETNVKIIFLHRAIIFYITFLPLKIFQHLIKITQKFPNPFTFHSIKLKSHQQSPPTHPPPSL